MMDIRGFKELILNYLRQEEEFIKEDICNNENLPKYQQVEQGLLIEDCTIIEQDGNDYLLKVSENNSKLRPGDLVSLISDNRKSIFRATIIENGFDNISLNCDKKLDWERTYSIKVVESVMIGNLIRLIERIDEGTPGAHFLKILAGIESPSLTGLGKLRHGTFSISDTMNDSQRAACIACFNRPNIYCIQGPPGTGKTNVLSTIASAY